MKTKTQREIRAHSGIEIRAANEDDTPKLSGYAAVFGSRSEDLGGFFEIIRPGAFTRTLREQGDIYALADHDTAKRLARTKNETLALREDEHGLHVEFDLPDTQLGRDISQEVRTGLIDSMSFGFMVRADDWSTTEDGVVIRELIDVDLFEVSAVSFPAYRATELDVAKRSFDAFKEAQDKQARDFQDEQRARELRLRQPD